MLIFAFASADAFAIAFMSPMPDFLATIFFLIFATMLSPRFSSLIFDIDDFRRFHALMYAAAIPLML